MSSSATSTFFNTSRNVFKKLMSPTSGQGQDYPTDSESWWTAASYYPIHSPGANLPHQEHWEGQVSLQTWHRQEGRQPWHRQAPSCPSHHPAMPFAVVSRTWHFPGGSAGSRACRAQERQHHRGPWDGAGRTPCPTTPRPGKPDPMAPAPNPGLPDPVRENPRWGWERRGSSGLGEPRDSSRPRECGRHKAPAPATRTRSCPGAPRGRTSLAACQSLDTSFPPALPAQISIWDTCFPCTASFPGTEAFSAGRSQQ